MLRSRRLAIVPIAAVAICSGLLRAALACCPAPPAGQPVVNADQTVVILWDPATKTEHFIRRASFKAEAADFGFLVPTPTQPELEESGDGAFPVLAAVTAPRVISRAGGSPGCGCSANAPSGAARPLAAGVTVLEDKVVAGFHAVVLQAQSSGDLTEWLKANGYAYSPEVQAWAKPYIEQGWKFTAMKVAPTSGVNPATQTTTSPAGADDGAAPRAVAATALRMSFKTDRPLFPYREPDPTGAAQALGASHRLLRIYFLSNARYQGELTPQQAWTGQAAWAGHVPPADRQRALELLKLPGIDPQKDWFLTEFEDAWPYRPAPADLYFSPSIDQSPLERPPVVRYTAAPLHLAGAAPYVLAVAAIGFAPALRRSMRRRR